MKLPMVGLATITGSSFSYFSSSSSVSLFENVYVLGSGAIILENK